MANSSEVAFGNAAGATTISHFGIYDAASAGNLLCFGPIEGGAQPVTMGSPVSFAAGALTVSED